MLQTVAPSWERKYPIGKVSDKIIDSHISRADLGIEPKIFQISPLQCIILSIQKRLTT